MWRCVKSFLVCLHFTSTIGLFFRRCTALTPAHVRHSCAKGCAHWVGALLNPTRYEIQLCSPERCSSCMPASPSGTAASITIGQPVLRQVFRPEGCRHGPCRQAPVQAMQLQMLTALSRACTPLRQNVSSMPRVVAPRCARGHDCHPVVDQQCCHGMHHSQSNGRVQ